MRGAHTICSLKSKKEEGTRRSAGPRIISLDADEPSDDCDRASDADKDEATELSFHLSLDPRRPLIAVLNLRKMRCLGCEKATDWNCRRADCSKQAASIQICDNSNYQRQPNIARTRLAGDLLEHANPTTPRVDRVPSRRTCGRAAHELLDEALERSRPSR